MEKAADAATDEAQEYIDLINDFNLDPEKPNFDPTPRSECSGSRPSSAARSRGGGSDGGASDGGGPKQEEGLTGRDKAIMDKQVEYMRGRIVDKHSILEVEIETAKVKEKLKKIRRRVGGVYAYQDNEKHCAHHMHILEKRLSEAKTRYQHVLAACRATRATVDTLRREKMILKHERQLMHADLVHCRTEVKERRASVTHVRTGTKKLRVLMKKIEEAHKRKRQEFSARRKAISAQANQTQKHKYRKPGAADEPPPVPKGHRRGSISNFLGGGAGGKGGAKGSKAKMSLLGAMNKMKEQRRNTFGLAVRAKVLEMKKVKVQSYKAALEKIKGFMAIEDISQLPERFRDTEQKNLRNFNTLQELVRERETVERDLATTEATLAAAKDKLERETRKTKNMIVLLTRKVAEAERAYTGTMERQQHLRLETETLKASIWKIYVTVKSELHVLSLNPVLDQLGLSMNATVNSPHGDDAGASGTFSKTMAAYKIPCPMPTSGGGTPQSAQPSSKRRKAARAGAAKAGSASEPKRPRAAGKGGGKGASGDGDHDGDKKVVVDRQKWAQDWEKTLTRHSEVGQLLAAVERGVMEVLLRCRVKRLLMVLVSQQKKAFDPSDYSSPTRRKAPRAAPYKPKGGDGLDGASMFKNVRVFPKLQHALMRALHTGNVLHVAYLVALGANIDCVETSQGKSAAYIAWENGRADLAQWLESARWEAGRGGGVQGPADAQGAARAIWTKKLMPPPPLVSDDDPDAIDEYNDNLELLFADGNVEDAYLKSLLQQMDYNDDALQSTSRLSKKSGEVVSPIPILSIEALQRPMKKGVAAEEAAKKKAEEEAQNEAELAGRGSSHSRPGSAKRRPGSAKGGRGGPRRNKGSPKSTRQQLDQLNDWMGGAGY